MCIIILYSGMEYGLSHGHYKNFSASVTGTSDLLSPHAGSVKVG